MSPSAPGALHSHTLFSPWVLRGGPHQIFALFWLGGGTFQIPNSIVNLPYRQAACLNSRTEVRRVVEAAQAAAHSKDDGRTAESRKPLPVEQVMRAVHRA